MTINRASVEEGARLAAEATPGPWWISHHPDNVEHFIEPEVGNIDEDNEADAAFIAHWNPEFAAELGRELQRLWRVEEALEKIADNAESWHGPDTATGHARALVVIASQARAALANPAAAAGDG